MKKLFEKLRDLLYDSIDYIIILAVIIGVISIINWRIGGLFPKDEIMSEDSEKSLEIPEDNSSDESEGLEEEENDGGDEILDGEIVDISIPPGSTLSEISEILVENQLVEDKQEFSNKTVELGYDTKLKYGEYEIPLGSSEEEILEILIN